MSNFGLTPAGPFPPPTGDGFGTAPQYQNQGVDLGGPDAATLNFATGLTATRTGDVVSVAAEGGGPPASTAILAAYLTGSMPSPTANVRVNNWVLSTTPFDDGSGRVVWNSTTAQLQINVSGVYAFDLQGQWVGASAGNFWDPTNVSPFGFMIDGSFITPSLHTRRQATTLDNSGVNAVECWSDRFTRVCANGELITITMWYDRADGAAPASADAALALVVTRLMDGNPI